MATRREFLADVGRGMLVASVGPAVATDLGLSPAFADAPDTPTPEQQAEDTTKQEEADT